MKLKKGFASDNWSGVCPEIMQALQDVNPGHNEAYGELNDLKLLLKNSSNILGRILPYFLFTMVRQPMCCPSAN